MQAQHAPRSDRARRRSRAQGDRPVSPRRAETRRKAAPARASAAPSSLASAANRVRATESPFAKASNGLLQQNLPIGDLSRCSKLSQLFDHLVGDLLKMQRHVNTKCLGGLDIDHQLELRGLLDRQVDGLLTLENPTGVDSIQTMRIRKTASVAYQAASLGVLAERKDRSHAVAGSQCCKLFAPTKEKRIRADHEPCRPQLDQACKDGVEVALGTRFQYMNLQPEGAGRRPQVSYLSLREIGAGRIDEQRNVSNSGDHLMQQLQPLRPYL